MNETFETPPKFQILDFYGKSITGKTGVIFSWIEPQFGEDEGVENHITARKFFIFENEVSEESDIDGYIEFPDLKIIGAAEKVAYIMVSVDGVVTVWT